ncbi:MAG: TatD family hydrolase [Clostridiales bacterium]|nr:TatD family hydrolase [Clostridiales bacterium]
MLFDSHAHYYDRRFEREYEGGADSLLARLFSSDENYYILNVGADLRSSTQCIAQAARYPRMYAAAGIHPSDTRFCKNLASDMDELRRLFANGKKNKLVALGEIGLDYHYPDTDKKKQAEYFHAQMSLAAELGLPVIVHDREAHGDCMAVVRAYPDVCGVFHSYSGSVEMARELIKRGWYISFSGTVTFKNAHRVRDVAAALPIDSILIETDSPYLAPHPHRGQLNHSGYVGYVAETLADLHRLDFETVAEITAQNGAKLFNIQLPDLP